MWQRRSFHECADELAQISEIFRSEWRSHYRFDMSLAKSNPTLIDTSKKGVCRTAQANAIPREGRRTIRPGRLHLHKGRRRIPGRASRHLCDYDLELSVIY